MEDEYELELPDELAAGVYADYPYAWFALHHLILGDGCARRAALARGLHSLLGATVRRDPPSTKARRSVTRKFRVSTGAVYGLRDHNVIGGKPTRVRRKRDVTILVFRFVETPEPERRS